MNKTASSQKVIYLICKKPAKEVVLLENGIPVYCGKSVNFHRDTIERTIKKIESNLKQIYDIDEMAKSKGELLGRFIIEPVADGKAYYQIIQVNKLTVTIKLVENIGDDYMVHYWGRGTVISREYAESSVNYRDKTISFFIN